MVNQHHCSAISFINLLCGDNTVLQSLKKLCTLCVQGLFQLFWEKAPGLNWEKYAAFWVILGIFFEAVKKHT